MAYVQLRPGQLASEQELLAHAQGHISERAAVPKAVMIVAALPLTAVGKLFKPTLTLREIEATVRAEAQSLGLVLDEVRAVQDPQRGVIARYTVKTGDASALVAALGRYTFPTERTLH